MPVIREEIAQRLSSYMRPTRIVEVAALPRSHTGKLDIQALQEITAPPAERLVGVPRDTVESALAALWERVLGAGAVSRDDDFFDLGGDSLSALSLLAGIEKVFRRRLPIASLLRAPTLAALAHEIRSLALERPSLIVPMQPAGKRPPFFCVHGLGGHILRLIPLARSFAPDTPFLGLQCPGLDDGEPVPRTIEDLARVFVDEMRTRLGPGPCYLGGMSFGGIVAFEMARQMAATGREVDLLALFDTDLSEVLPGFRPAAPSRTDEILGTLRRFIGDRLGRSRRRVRRLFQGRDEVQKANEYRSFTRVLRANEGALAHYQPGLYPGKVTFLAATDRDPALYQEFIRRTGCDLEIVRVPGDHLSMLEPPHVETLAAELLRRM